MILTRKRLEGLGFMLKFVSLLGLLLPLLSSIVSAAILENFQVTQPPIVPKEAKQCTIKILQ